MTDSKILTGKWTGANNRNTPTKDLPGLMKRHEELAISDVTLALQESVKDFMAQYWDAKRSGFDTLEIIRQIEQHPDQGGFDFPFLKTLINLRETECKTGLYSAIDLDELFPRNHRAEIFSPAFQNDAAEYIKLRKQKTWSSASALKQFNAFYAASDHENTQTPAEKISASTNIALNILMHSWIKKRGVGEISFTPFLHNIGQLAEEYMDPASADFIDQHVAYKAQQFVKQLPYLQNQNMFAKLIHAEAQAAHEREQNQIGINEKLDKTVVPLRIKPNPSIDDLF